MTLVLYYIADELGNIHSIYRGPKKPLQDIFQLSNGIVLRAIATHVDKTTVRIDDKNALGPRCVGFHRHIVDAVCIIRRFPAQRLVKFFCGLDAFLKA